MSDDQGSPESHGVYGGAQRGDGKMQEEPSGTDASGGDGRGADEQEWAEKTETGGDAS